MEEVLDFDYTFKVILVGDTSVGKSSILARFIKDKFDDDGNPTMGV